MGEEITVETGGGWCRVSPTAGGYHLFFASGGDYHRVLMDEELFAEDRDRISLTGFDHLDDHAIQICPDGTFFHLASGSVTEQNDSVYSFSYNALLGPLHQSTLFESDPEFRFNDMPLLCGEQGRFTAFLDHDHAWPLFVELSADGEVVNSALRGELPVPEGSTILDDPDGGLLYISTSRDTRGIELSRITTDLELVSTMNIYRAEEGVRSHWPQGAALIGGHLFVAFVKQPDDAGYLADWGEIWLAIFDSDFQLVEEVPVLVTEAPDGAMRPALLQQGVELLLSYDRLEGGVDGDVKPRLIRLTIDPSLVKSGDTGEPAETGGDTADTGIEEEPGGCGCSSAPGRGGGALLTLAGAFAYRRRKIPSPRK